MRKGKITMIFTVAIAFFALACVMSMQFKLVNETDITSIENLREEELQEQLASWKQKYEDVQKQYKEVKEKIQEYADKKTSDIETSTLVKEELEEANLLLGITDVEGEGIEITINENKEDDFVRIKDSDLLSIINSLKYAGAEAISINEERILPMTDIVDIQYSFIKINGQRILAPYVIKAIGNKSHIESALLGNGGYAERLKNIGHQVTIVQKDNVLVKKHNGNITTKYIQEDENN